MKIKYYDVQKHWTKRIAPHLATPAVSQILVRDFNKFTSGRWDKRFTRGQVPADFETCMWDIDHVGPRPRFWDYVKHSACHWLVNFNLELARRTEPKREWRIITSSQHSTVFDGVDTLFDMNFLALGVSPEDCLTLAVSPKFGGRELPIGERLRVYRATHYSEDLKTSRRVADDTEPFKSFEGSCPEIPNHQGADTGSPSR